MVKKSSPPRAPARCFWAGELPEMQAYHDKEWGFPVRDDQRLFEKLTLEAFQSGLSWRTILNKRAGFRAAFHDFDVARIARYGAKDVKRLLADANIVRHRGKIEATINNAQRALEMIDAHGGLAAFVWRYEPDPKSRPARLDEAALRQLSTSAEAKALSKDLKKLGWSFVGPTTVYAFMQAAGLVNDHVHGCHAQAPALAARARFRRPTGAAAKAR